MGTVAGKYDEGSSSALVENLHPHSAARGRLKLGPNYRPDNARSANNSGADNPKTSQSFGDVKAAMPTGNQKWYRQTLTAGTDEAADEKNRSGRARTRHGAS
jgi:hypothetical protein